MFQNVVNPSTSILDTNILGSVVIKIRLAPPSCLMLGEAVEEAVKDLAAGASDTNISITAAAVILLQLLHKPQIIH